MTSPSLLVRAKNVYKGAALARAERSLTRRVSRDPNSPLIGDAPVIVSLTTYGSRLLTVDQTIESIGRGSIRPTRLILWLDEASTFDEARARLSKLIARGLEVRLTENLGPHKKYFPALAELRSRSDLTLVTADDDVLYPHTWLQVLVKASQKDPAAVHCYRARQISVRDGSIAPYVGWKRRLALPTVRATPRTFATGVSGVLYPQRMIDALSEKGLAFVDVAPRADDVWLHAVAVENEVRVRQVGTLPRQFPLVKGSQQSSLTDENVGDGGNDRQIAATYSPLVLRRLIANSYSA